MQKIIALIILTTFILYNFFGCSPSPSDSSSKTKKSSSNSSSLEKPFESIEDYSFDKYKVKIFPLSEKANINFSSNPRWKLYKTRLSRDYKNGDIDFAGYFITIIINCGVICRVGAMVDVRDGKIYSLPLDEGMGYAECCSSRNIGDEEGIYYKPDSRLFVSISCVETDIKNSKNKKQHKIYFINIWDENSKKFILKKKTEKNLIVEREK